MKIAVTSQNRKTITGHAGKCRKFWIYQTDGRQIVSKTLLELALAQSFHESHAGAAHPLDGIDAMISGGAGQGLIRRLNAMDILSLVTPETDPDSAVAAFLDGTLQVGQAEHHEGHGEHHRDGHTCCH